MDCIAFIDIKLSVFHCDEDFKFLVDMISIIEWVEYY